MWVLNTVRSKFITVKSYAYQFRYPFESENCSMEFIFESYNISEINWTMSTNKTKIYNDNKKGKWEFQSYTLHINNSDNESSVLVYTLHIKRNNFNRVLMFVLMPTIIITSFNIVCYLLPIGGIIALIQ